MGNKRKFSEWIQELEDAEVLILSEDPVVAKVTSDSRKAGPESVFVAIRGTQLDGHEFLQTAAMAGTLAALVEKGHTFERPEGMSLVAVDNPRRSLAELSALLYGPLPAPMGANVVGVTGTNGKTTTTFLLEAILQHAGALPAVLGTISYRVGETLFPAPLTTPSSEVLWHNLLQMHAASATHVLMEVSSHALDQHRVDGLAYRAVGFTNLSQDHLDYHGDMETYCRAKQRLFSELVRVDGRALVNADDPVADAFVQASRAPVWTYSARLGGHADLQVLEAEVSVRGIRAKVKTPQGLLALESPLVGQFNLSNLLLACGLALALEVPIPTIEEGLASSKAVSGRMEVVAHEGDFQVLVDYAHTPDALAKVLQSLRPICQGRLIVLFGCGGDRDAGKRPLMGEVVARHADVSVVTSDNPRTEDPRTIVEQILEGVRPHQARLDDKDPGGTGYWVALDRKEAIHGAVKMARAGDLVLIAGKGHEPYQIIGTMKYPFDDCVIAQQALSQD